MPPTVSVEEGPTSPAHCEAQMGPSAFSPGGSVHFPGCGTSIDWWSRHAAVGRCGVLRSLHRSMRTGNPVRRRLATVHFRAERIAGRQRNVVRDTTTLQRSTAWPNGARPVEPSYIRNVVDQYKWAWDSLSLFDSYSSPSFLYFRLGFDSSIPRRFPAA